MAINRKTDLTIEPYLQSPRPRFDESASEHFDNELRKIEETLEQLVEAGLQTADAAPVSPRRGMTRFAVSPWDPGSGSNKMYLFNGSDWVLMGTVTSSGLFLSALIDDTTPTLSADLDADGNKVINVADPANDQDAVTKIYLEENSLTKAQAAARVIVGV